MPMHFDIRLTWIRLTSLTIAAVLGIFAVVQRPAFAGQKGDFIVELNKLAQNGNFCELYFLNENDTSHAFRDLALELVFLNRDGVFSYQNVFDFGSLADGRTTLVSFALKHPNCRDIGEVLVNKVEKCDIPAKASVDCDAVIRLRNRTKLKFSR